MKPFFRIITIITLLVLVSCRDKSEYLVGTWKQIPFTNPDSVRYKHSWKFYAGDALEVTTLDVKTGKDTTIKYTYSLARKEFSITNNEFEYVTGNGDIRGEYYVDELNKKRFKIRKTTHPGEKKGGAYARKEFVKE